jgi:hypothetical protein
MAASQAPAGAATDPQRNAVRAGSSEPAPRRRDNDVPAAHAGDDA